MNIAAWYLCLGIVVTVTGALRLLMVQDLIARLIALNVTGAGSLMLLMALAARSNPIDPVLSALVLTGLVITAAFTSVGAVLIRRLEDHPDIDDGEASS
jgi:multicomponent Na+:H+ antiporter subunit C